MSSVDAANRLARAVADYDGGRSAVDYGNVAAEWTAFDRAAALVSLPQRRVLVAEGEDRSTFLQGQVANDVNALVPGAGQAAVVLTAQGRVVSLVHLYDAGETIEIVTDAAHIDVTLQRLTQFLVADDVEIEPAPAADCIGVAGPSAGAVLAELGLEVPAAAGSWHRVSGQIAGVPVVARARGELRVPLVELYADGDAEPLWQALVSAGAAPAGSAAFEIVRVESGTARFGVDVDAERIAMEARLEWAIHFSKGCYVGQEVVERAFSRGKLNRRLCLLAVDGPVVVGDAVEGATAKDAVTSVVRSPRHGTLVLAYVPVERSQPGEELTIVSMGGRMGARVLDWPHDDAAAPA